MKFEVSKFQKTELCKCGWGKATDISKHWPRVGKPNYFISGHNNKKKYSPNYCLICKKLLTQKQLQLENKYCSQKCFHISRKNSIPWNKNKKGFSNRLKGMHIQTNTGRTHFKKGHIFSKEILEKRGRSISIALTGKPKSPEFRELMRKLKKGNKNRLNKFHSKETKEKISRSRKGKCTGSKNPRWKSGITPLRIAIYSSEEYQIWRNGVFKRDNYTCQKCGDSGVYIEAHHKKSFHQILQEFVLEHHPPLSLKENKIEILKLLLKHKPLWNIENGLTLCRPCHDKTKGKKNAENSLLYNF
jgi:ribosomal protein S27AE